MLLFASDSLIKMWIDNLPNLMDPTNKRSEICHAISSSLKALSSWNSHRTLQESREACGGLGYSHYAGIGMIIGEDDINSTWEGDNHVLLMQTGRFILKAAQGLLKGKPLPESLEFLTAENPSGKTKFAGQVTKAADLVGAFQYRVNVLMHEASVQFMAKPSAEGWNSLIPFQIEPLSKSYGELFALRSFLKVIEEEISCQKVRAFMEKFAVL